MNEKCQLCPRQCGVDRQVTTGYCGVGGRITAARAALHFGEEPCISGSRGSGTVFFAGCHLGCVYCQNYSISRGAGGMEITPEKLGDILLRLEEQGAHNINLVTPMHFTLPIIKGLEQVKHRLGIPVAINTGGYELPQTVEMWSGLADIWIPDLKYKSRALSAKYSGAPDYFEVACRAVEAMHRQQPTPVVNDGIMQRGMIIRHMVLPGGYKDSLDILAWLQSALPLGGFLLSLMRQYTPTGSCSEYPEIDRKVTSLEYGKVEAVAAAMGFDGYSQDKASAGEGYVPDFNLEGIKAPEK